jgi:D-cysteine desulfhydrase
MNESKTTVPRVKLARLPTPLEPLNRLSAELQGPRIWVKRDDLTEGAASGNKLRKLEFSVGQALQENATVLITAGGIQSNHCRATAIVAAKLGLKSHLILRGKPPADRDGNLLLDDLVGAKITFATAAQFENLDSFFEDIADEYRTKGDVPFSIPIGASDEIGLWGYIECARELKLDFEFHDIAPEFIISAAGSGGTQGGMILGNHKYGLGANVSAFSVSNDETFFKQKIGLDIERWQRRYGENVPELPINIIDGYIGPGYGRADSHVFDTIRRVAKTEGIIFDPVYTGKAFDGMLQELAKGRFDGARDILFLHTGGIFGLFPQRDQFAD